MKKQRLPLSSERSEQVVHALFQIANVVSHAAAPADLYGFLHEVLGTLFDATNFCIGLYDEEQDRLHYPYVADEKVRSYPDISQVTATDTASASVIRSGKPRMLSRVEMEAMQDSKVRVHYSSPVSEIWLGVPLKTRGRVIGVMAIQDYHDPARYSLEDMEVLSAVAGLVASAVDYQRVDETRRESERRHRRISEHTTDAIYLTDMDGKYIDVNKAACSILGYSREQLLKLTVEDVDCNISNENFRKYYQATPEGTSSSFESLHRRQDGSRFFGEISSLKYREKNREFIVGIARDITERKKNEEKLRIFANRMQAYFESASDAIMVHPFQKRGFGRFLEINGVACRRYGYSRQEFLELTAADISKSLHSPEDALPDYKKRLMSKGSAVFESVHVKKNGDEFPVEISASIIEQFDKPFVLSVVRDISERKKAEAEQHKLQSQLRQAQRMESIGRLAGGIAHDFNNLLMGIQGRLSLLSLTSGGGEEWHEHVDAIQEYIKSATSLTGQLLGFARGGKYNTEVLDARELLRASSSMFGRTRKEIRIRLVPAAAPALIEVDRQQLEQVLLNIYINAWQAMPGGGSLTLGVEEAEIDEALAEIHKVVAGKYVRLTIADTGTGMDEETRQRIFDPFFSTKEKGRGTGLGLASAYGIINNHNGFITVESELGHGTLFAIHLPGSDKTLAPVREETKKEIVSGSETILLVDDEAMIIEVGRAMLESLGYTVFVASSGAQALEVLEVKEGMVDLVLLDMIMPGMDGGQVFEVVHERWPQVPVMLSSGYSIDGQAAKLLDRGAVGFLQKPFDLSALSQKLRTVLSRS